MTPPLVLLAALSCAAPVPKADPPRELLVMKVEDNKWQLFLVNASTGEANRLSDKKASDMEPAWSRTVSGLRSFPTDRRGARCGR